MTGFRYLYSLLIFIVGPLFLFGQQTVDFGLVNELSNSVGKAKYNTKQFSEGKDDSVNVYFTLMGDRWTGTAVSSPSSIKVIKGDSGEFSMRFTPQQNVLHKGIVLIESAYNVEEIVEIQGQGTYSNNYYASTRNKSEEDLKTALNTILNQGTVSLGYNRARDNMYSTIDNVGGQVECVYTGKKATFNTRTGANGAGFNCEHTYPQGFFSSVDPEKSDIHHLFPTTTTSNSRRGNDPFGIVSNSSWQDGGSKSGGGKFEPRDSHKGAVARSMIYFVLRHGDFNDSGTPFLSKQESVLRSWHNQFAVSQKEIDRNNAIFALQKNRSPLVDYPQLLERISKVSGNSVSTPKYELLLSRNLRNLTTDTLEEGEGDIFQGVIYNAGNQPVKINSISDKNNSNYTIKPSKSTLSPGDYCTFKFSVKSGADGGYWSFSETFVIKTNSTGQENIEFTYTGVYNSPGSVSELSLTKLKSFPNPSSSMLTFSGLSNQELELPYKVIDNVGRMVQAGSLAMGSINISKLATGSYSIILGGEESPQYQSRFIKQ